MVEPEIYTIKHDELNQIRHSYEAMIEKRRNEITFLQNQIEGINIIVERRNMEENHENKN